jgi:hypothetical protein
MALEGRPRGKRLAVESRLRAAWWHGEHRYAWHVGWLAEGVTHRPNQPRVETLVGYAALTHPTKLTGQQRNEIVFADALQNKESERRRAAVGYQMRSRRPDDIDFAGL